MVSSKRPSAANSSGDIAHCEAELARLKAQPAAWTVLLQQSQANFQKNFGGNVAANWVYNDLRELFADAAPVQPVQPAPLTDEQIRRFADENTPNTETGSLNYRNFARDIETFLRTGGAG